MSVLLAIVIGVLYAAAVYLMMRRSIVKLVLGLALLAHAANILILVASRPMRGAAPIIPPGAEHPIGPVADPLPQALILTAIVIGFGLITYSIVLILRSYRSLGINDLDNMKATDT